MEKTLKEKYSSIDTKANQIKKYGKGESDTKKRRTCFTMVNCAMEPRIANNPCA